MIRLLLDHGADPCASYDGTTVLHELVKGNKNISALFIAPQRNFDLEVRNASGETPLLTIAQRNSSPDHTQEGNAEGRSATGLLILHGANTRAVDGQGNSMLHLAVKTSYTTQDDLQLILNEAPELMNLPKVEGITPLHCAVQRWWHPGTFKFYWEHGADIHAADGKGNSLLHFLLRGEFQVSKSGEVVRCQLACDLDFLLAQGLDINLLNETGETPIFSFIRYGKVRARNYKDRFPGFIESPIFDHFTKVGVDWKIRNKKGQSLLHAATAAAAPTASTKHPSLFKAAPDDRLYEIFKALVEFGLEARLEDQTGRTSIDVAADLGHERILDMFRR